MDEDFDDLCDLYKFHISEGEALSKRLEEFEQKNVRGINKLQRKIKKDVKFLLETLESNNLKKEHLVCSNLHFYKAIIEETLNQPDYEALLETFLYKPADNNCRQRLTVDIVSHKGQQWTKVIARNPDALRQIYREGDSFGKKSIIHQASSYIQAAAQNLHLYCPPQVVFSFVNGVPEEMKTFLEKSGIKVEGNIITVNKEDLSSNSLSDSDSEEHFCEFTHVVRVPFLQRNFTKLNLCVTTMIAFVSSLTNGGCHSTFNEPLLNQQAEWERKRPVKPLLDKLFEGKELICCFAAADDFKNIINMVGGVEEQCRAANLLMNVKVVPGASVKSLKQSGRIKARSLEIFGTGQEHEAITVTANKGFVHAAKQKGMKFAVIIHESRALTERKQLSDISQNVRNSSDI